MHFSKGFVATIILGALPAEIAAVPALAPIPAATNASFVDLSLEPRRDRLAVVNTYDSYDCKGETTQFTAAGRHANVCHAGVGNSIQVYAQYVHTSHKTFVTIFFFFLARLGADR